MPAAMGDAGSTAVATVASSAAGAAGSAVAATGAISAAGDATEPTEAAAVAPSPSCGWPSSAGVTPNGAEEDSKASSAAAFASLHAGALSLKQIASGVPQACEGCQGSPQNTQW